MKTTKPFDCVRMKDEAQLKRARLLRGLTPEQLVEYYRQADQKLRNRRQQLVQRNADKVDLGTA